MGHSKGFMEVKRQEAKEQDPIERIKSWLEYHESWQPEEIRTQAARCMDCGTPFCQTGVDLGTGYSGCPLNNLIPEWNDLVYRGKWYEAYLRLAKTNNFPEFTGRVCPAPCEGGCTAALVNDPVAIKSIEKDIIDHAFAEGWVKPAIPEERTGLQTAVIGSGPAGLAAADELNRMGHSVTVYERDDTPGGLLMYGIPNMKLDKRQVERRVDLLKASGIEFIVNTDVGTDISFEELRRKFDSVIIATGATAPRDLEIDGRDANGIHYAMHYLTESTKTLMDGSEPVIDARNKKVVVIGGGDTGADCVATALRQGASSVHQFGKHGKLPSSRHETNPWPEPLNVFTLDYAYEESEKHLGYDPRQYEIMTRKFVKNEDGSVSGIEVTAPDKFDGAPFVWEADLVLIAIGFAGAEQKWLDHTALSVTGRRTFRADDLNYASSEEGVFIAGDARRGQSLIVWAIQEGRKAAKSCDEFLQTQISKIS